MTDIIMTTTTISTQEKPKHKFLFPRDPVLISRVLICMSVWFFLMVWHSGSVPDGDNFWQATAGRDILANGFPHKLLHSMHDIPLTLEHPLFDVMIYLIYNNFHVYGMWFYGGFVIALLHASYIMFARLYSRDHWFLLSAISTVCTASLLTPYRASILTCIVLLQLAVNLYKDRYWAVIPAVIIIINIQAALWPAVLIISVLYALPESMFVPIRIWLKEKYKFFIYMFLVPLATLVNPYGINNTLYIFKSMRTISGTAKDIIFELKPPPILSLQGLVMILGVIMLTTYVNKYKKMTSPAEVIWSSGIILFSITARRNFWFGIFAFIITAGRSLDGAGVRRYEKKVPLFLYLVFAASLALYIFSQPDGIGDDLYTTIEAADYLDDLDRKDDMTLYTEFNSGSYMQWRGYDVFIDPRPEVYDYGDSPTVWDEFLQVWAGSAYYEGFMEKYNFTHVLVTSGSYFDLWMKNQDGWYTAVLGNGYNLYERTDFRWIKNEETGLWEYK